MTPPCGKKQMVLGHPIDMQELIAPTDQEHQNGAEKSSGKIMPPKPHHNCFHGNNQNVTDFLTLQCLVLYLA